MKKFLVRILALLGALWVTFASISWGMHKFSMHQKNQKPLILCLDFSRGVSEAHEISPLLEAATPRPHLYKIIRAIELAARDPQVKGIFAHIDESKMGLAQCQEIRDAIMHFRSLTSQQEKSTVAFAETFGNMSCGILPYFLATAFENIILQPYGLLSITGLTAEVPFGKEAMDRLHLIPQVTQRGAFKSLMESLTESDFSPHNREALQHILSSLMNLMIRDIAVAREITETEIQDAIDHAPLLGPQALQAGLVDSLGHIDAARAAVTSQTDPDALFISPEAYLERVAQQHAPLETAPKFALITLEGSIQRGGPRTGLMGAAADAHRIAQALRDAAQDNEIRAIILRLNTPGGCPIASEMIWGAVEEAKRAHKPVIISMSDYAASGGYWIACAGTKIVAHASTMTGSIGVISSKIVTDKFWEDWGVKWGVLSEGHNAELWSSVVPYSPEGHKKMDELIDHLYSGFIQKVAAGRNLPEEHVQHIAKGRVWSGEDALRYGLIDQMGGYREAIELAQIETGLQGQDVRIVLYPEPKTLLESLFGLFQDPGSVVTQARTHIFQGALQQLRAAVAAHTQAAQGHLDAAISPVYHTP